MVIRSSLPHVTVASKNKRNFYDSDINECTMATSNCSSNATCINTPGSFICTCNQGYTGNGVVCTGMSNIGHH